MTIKPASGLSAWFLRTFGYGGITMPWGTAYILSARWSDLALHVHESQHLRQIEQDGAFVWTVKYLWYNLRYGYAGNPYELDAQKVSGVK